MEFLDIPLGFAMLLAQNRVATETFGALPELQREALLDKAHHARSEDEMRHLVESLTFPGF